MSHNLSIEQLEAEIEKIAAYIAEAKIEIASISLPEDKTGNEKNIAHAASQLTEVVRHAPRDHELPLVLAQLHKKRGEHDLAIRLLTPILQQVDDLQPSQRDALRFELAQNFLRAGLVDRAEELLLHLTQGNHPSNRAHEARKLLLEIYQQERNWPLAIELARTLKSQDFSFQHELAQYHCELAQAALIKSDWSAARAHVADALAALSLGPLVHNGPLLLCLARGHVQCGDAHGPASGLHGGAGAILYPRHFHCQPGGAAVVRKGQPFQAGVGARAGALGLQRGGKGRWQGNIARPLPCGHCFAQTGDAAACPVALARPPQALAARVPANGFCVGHLGV